MRRRKEGKTMTVTVLKALLKEKKLRAIHDVLSMYNPVDLAELLSELDDCVPSPATVEQTLDAMALPRRIEAWLGALPERERRLVLRRFWYGVALSVLAALEGERPARLAQLMLRLRRSRRAHLEAEGAEI